MSTRNQEQQPRFIDRLGRFLQKSRLALIIIVAVLAAFIVGYFGYTELQRRAQENATMQAEKAQELYQEWQAEPATNTEARQKLEDQLRAQLASIRRRYPRQYGAQRAYFIEANLDYDKEQWKPAAEQFSALAARYPRSYLAPLALAYAGVSQEQLGDNDAALQAYEKAVSSYKDSFLVPHLLFSMGRLYEQQGDFEKAFQAYTRLEEEYPLSNWTKVGRNRIIELKIAGKVAK
jgi:tetratricopeptide (TPR) repeat protein